MAFFVADIRVAIHSAAERCLGLKLGSHYKLNISSNLNELINDLDRLSMTVFGRNISEMDKFRVEKYRYRGAWAADCPGEIFFRISSRNTGVEIPLDWESVVAITHEISHLLVVAGSLVGQASQTEREKLLLVRSADIPWKGGSRSEWFHNWAPNYLPLKDGKPSVDENEAITHLFTQILVYEIANALNEDDKADLLSELSDYDTKLAEDAPNYLAITTYLLERGQHLDSLLNDEVLRRHLGRLVGCKIVKDFPGHVQPAVEIAENYPARIAKFIFRTCRKQET
jgi:hypothetical protein